MSKVTILNGGVGRELERRGAPFKQPEWSALAMMEAPEMVQAVHKAYIDAGAQVIITNSYALVPFHIGEERFKALGATLAEQSALVAREAVNQSSKNDIVIAGSIPPLFGSYRADLYQAELADDIALPLITALNPHIDLWLNETQSLIEEALTVKSLVDRIDTEHKPYWVSFTLEDAKLTEQPQLRSGETVVAAVHAMIDTGVDAILFNCSQPEVITAAIELTQKILAQSSSAQAKTIKIGAYANAFPPQPKEAKANDMLNEVRRDLTPTTYLEWAQKWHSLGAELIGGCCGIGPEHIQVLSKNLN
ncbi:homocysteine S-methyltransferase family protein [Amphritea sp. 2_MG-2023]|uniref:homocysteine S-methyltransferase family protein n=1 Tax=Amphritea TaxID=515417 RepID=UPI001C066E05|nr:MULTISPECIES: homocysteine S-methyltransferase family protein [Amphritea]MBU2966663.1 homocysteine S-methyltransferase family protein [Amphritea atlantica]MDO6417478.1 homocysteine S-methyltransferase family protein [Amphritea sp. 2_MG-2023]